MEWHGAPVADEEGANLVVRRGRRNSGLGHCFLALIVDRPPDDANRGLPSPAVGSTRCRSQGSPCGRSRDHEERRP